MGIYKINKQVRNMLIVATCVFIIAITSTIVLFVRQSEERNLKNEMEAINPGGTGGDFQKEQGFSIIGRGKLVSAIRQQNTEIIEQGLKKRLLKDITDHPAGFQVVIQNEGVQATDPPQKWHYQIDITVNDTYKYIITMNADPDQEFTYDIQKQGK